MPRKITYKEFEEKIINKYGNNIDLSLIDKDNFNYSDKQKFICKKHNQIKETLPKIMLRGNSSIICDKCYCEFFKNNLNVFPNNKKIVYLEDLLKLCEEKQLLINTNTIILHKNNKIFNNDPIEAICNKHGKFITTYYKILNTNYYGCEKCRREYNQQKLIEYGVNRRNNLIEKFYKIHGHQYDYSLVNFNGKLNKIKIICNKHGIFEMFPSMHLRGEGCPKCNQDKLNCERRLGELLKEAFQNEEIIQQYHGILGRQSLDYYFPKYKIGIEYQGSQHFINNDWYNDHRHSFKHIQELDLQKFNKCKNNNIKIFYFTFLKEFENINYLDKVYISFNELKNDIKKYLLLNYNKEKTILNIR